MFSVYINVKDNPSLEPLDNLKFHHLIIIEMNIMKFDYLKIDITREILGLLDELYQQRSHRNKFIIQESATIILVLTLHLLNLYNWPEYLVNPSYG